ncbi:ATP-grasp domain-containing protein [Arcicella rigui]|uniref:ATP-grasp domain-containing protein n=1 Tax=Arcicella rigui TaxID=797020 RepID=A0ABU5Q5X0_9BACT|nr:ATP-grasp domain-containing protein [Arcicella rigui]MEA5138244.1 ATP-grasp domain-containing protein [Arcicella rigui]
MNKIQLPLWFIKLTHFEYWTWWMFYIPLLPYWLYQAVRTRSLTFFTNADPCIDYGGFFGESKIDILKQIPSAFLPTYFFVKKESTLQKVLEMIEEKQLNFPIICKPNVGERGSQVEKINDKEALEKYLKNLQEDFIIQEFITFEIELGVLYYRLPEETKGQVSSVTRKEFLSVIGDGKSSIEALMQASTRARFQLETMRLRLGEKIKEVIPVGEKRLLEPIGNHCRGTKFLDNNFLINEKLNQVFDKIALPIEGFHYGRFDMKVKSIEDLYEGKNIKIMELNGVSSEPGHIYDPKNTVWKAYRDLAKHWKIIADISIQQQKRGVQPIAPKIIWQVAREHFA